MDRVVVRLLVLAALAILIVAALGDRARVQRALVVAGRRVATAVGSYHATMPLVIEPRCSSVAVQAWGQRWIGVVPSALAPESGRPSVPQDVGLLTRTSYNSATFADGGGLSFVMRRTGQPHSTDTTC
jgi:hypothetical protein